MKALELLETFQFVAPGPLALNCMAEAEPGSRTFVLSNLRRLAEGYIRTCCWCNVGRLDGKVRKYCTPECRESANLYCAPQIPSSKIWILVNMQRCSCAICGLDWSEEIETRIYRQVARYTEAKRDHPEWFPWFTGKVTGWHVGHNTGHIWHVDHRIPIHQGGDGFGLANVQVVCKDCHLKKTSEERR